MAADRSIQALAFAMSKPALAIEDKKESTPPDLSGLPKLPSCSYIYENEVQKYYPNRESVICPKYGYAIAHCRREITYYLLELVQLYCRDCKLPLSAEELLIFASTYYSFNRNLEMLIEDASFTWHNSTNVKNTCEFLSSKEENIYRSILESVIEIMKKRDAPFVKPSTGLLSCIPDAPLMNLFNFAESYLSAISNSILEQCSEFYTRDTLEKIIFDAKKKYYGVQFLLLPDMMLEAWFDDDRHLGFKNRTSFLEDKLSQFDSEASSVLENYSENNGVYVSASPLWNPSGKKILEKINTFFRDEEELQMDVDFISSSGPFDTTLTNETFLIFKGDDDSCNVFDINNLLPRSIIKGVAYEDVIGVGFRFTEEMDLNTLKNLSIQAQSLALTWRVPTFFYHPFLGLKHIPATRLLDMQKKVASASPLIDFEKAMQKYSIIWQKSQMQLYDALDPESCVFSFQEMDAENTEEENYLFIYAEEERISFSFSFPHLQNPLLFPGKVHWFEDIIPAIQLGSKLYLDRDNKITPLLNKRKTFYLKHTFTRYHEEFKRILSRLAYPLALRYEVTDLNLTLDLINNETILHCKFTHPNEKPMALFGHIYTNNSILDTDAAYLLVRRLVNCLRIEARASSPTLLLSAEISFFTMETLTISLSLHELNKELIVKIFEKFKAIQKPSARENPVTLSSFLYMYLFRYDHISLDCKAQVVLSIMQSLSRELPWDGMIRCLLWCVAHKRFDELNQLSLSTVMAFRSALLKRMPPLPEETAALLILEKITPLTPTPTAAPKIAVAIAPPHATLAILPVPKPTERKIESKSEEKKEEPEKILWQGKEINTETPLAVVIQYALDQYYLKPYPEKSEKLINRPLHGGTHAIMTVLLVDLFKELFKKYYPDFLIDSRTQKSRLSDEEDKLVYLMALYHDSGNTREDQGAETDQTVHADHFYRDVIKMGFSIEASQKCRLNMIHKDNKDNQNIGKVILHDADCLEFLRCSSKENYDLTRLNIYHLIKNNCPSVMRAFQEDIQNIINYYKSFLTLIYQEKIQQRFESKELNLREHFYIKMQEEITHYRLMRAMVPGQSTFPFFQIVSVHKRLAVHRLYASQPMVLFYSYNELDNNKIKSSYLNELPESLESKHEEKDDGDEHPSKTKKLPLYRFYESNQTLDSEQKFEGVFFLRGLRGKYSEEATVWDRNLAILREEKITSLSELQKRYTTEPLQHYRFRPATLILPNVPVKSRWGSCLHILLKPSTVSFWGGFKKNVFSDYFEAKDFAFKDRLPRRIIKASPSMIIAPKVKTLQTIETLTTKLGEMEAVRKGQKISPHYRYFGCSALDSNEVFLMNQDSLSSSIEAVGICCDLTSHSWLVDVATAAQEILTLIPTLPPKIRYFFYLPEKGLTPVSLAEISLIARGRIQSDLKGLGLTEGLDLFNLPRIRPEQIMVGSSSLDKVGDLENQKFDFKFNNSQSMQSLAFMRAGIPCIQVGSDIYFDSEGVFRALAKTYSQLNLYVVQRLLAHFDWTMLELYQVSGVLIAPLLDEEQDKTSIKLSFTHYGSALWKDVVEALLTWMGYPVRQDKLRLLLEYPLPTGRNVQLTLSYPQAFAHVQQTLTQYKEKSYKEEKLIETFTSWNLLPEKQKNLLNFCRILAIELTNPRREEAIFSAINDIVPSFKDIHLGYASGIMKLFYQYDLHGWTESQCVKLIAQFLLVLHTHCPLSLKRVLHIIERNTPSPLLFALFSSKRLEIKLESSASSFFCERLYYFISQGKDYVVESALALIVKYAEDFSLDQLTQMLWTLIWKKQTDIKLIGREGLFKIEQRFRGKEATSSLSLHVMHSLLCGKQRELKTLGEEKSYTALDSASSRKRKKLDSEDTNDPKHSRFHGDPPADPPADPSTTSSP